MTDEEFYAKRFELISRNISDNDPEMIALFEQRAKSVEKTSFVKHQSHQHDIQSPQSKTQYISEEEFYERYFELLSKNISENDPEMIALFELRAKSQSMALQNSHKKTNIDLNSPQIQTKKSHIIIDRRGNYFLLDSKLQVIDSVYTNPILNFITRKHNLRTFKKQLNFDFKKYKKYCQKANISVDPDFTYMHKRMKYYLDLCPDADYNILELIRLNVHNMDSSYRNYQSMCAEYLHELAKKTHGNLDNMPFGIYFSTDDYVTSDHQYIAYQFDGKTNPVETFRNIYYSEFGKPDCLDDYRCYEAIGKYNPQFTHIKHLRTPSIQER